MDKWRQSEADRYQEANKQAVERYKQALVNSLNGKDLGGGLKKGLDPPKGRGWLKS
jgi:hypothetical protein